MIFPILLACFAGVLVGLSRQLNGRLSLSTSPLIASFWNHAIGFVGLTILVLLTGPLLPPGVENAPAFAFLSGPIGVVFVAAGSWCIARIGAVNTALLMIAGQMISGVAIDLLAATPRSIVAMAAGVALILAGMATAQWRGNGRA